MPAPSHGQIVKAQVTDPQGRNPKIRPLVVLTSDQDISRGARIVGAAISTFYRQLSPNQYVTLPWHRNRHPQTGLTADCAAVCVWLVEIDQADVLSIAGRVPDAQMQEIILKVATLNP